MKQTLFTNDWYNRPSRKILVLFFSAWLFSLVLILLAATDLFREPLFQQRNTLVLILVASSTASVFRLFLNYRRNR